MKWFIPVLLPIFFVAGADAWRMEAWRMIRIRKDLLFFIITKRIDRMKKVLPPDWGDGYENVIIGCTIENQKMANYRLPIFIEMPIRHKVIICAPLLEVIHLEKYLNSSIEEVSVGGESGLEARICDYDWVLSIRDQCIRNNIPFNFHQTGARLRKGGKVYRIPRAFQHKQAAKANINWNIRR